MCKCCPVEPFDNSVFVVIAGKRKNDKPSEKGCSLGVSCTVGLSPYPTKVIQTPHFVILFDGGFPKPVLTPTVIYTASINFGDEGVFPILNDSNIRPHRHCGILLITTTI